MEKKDNKEKSKARKKALGLAATAAAAAIAPQAAEIAVQKTEIPAPVQEAPEISVPEPVREEYAKPRPLKTIGDLIKGVFGIGTARAQTPPSYFPYADRVDPSRPRLPVIPPPPPPSRDLPGGITVSPRLQPPASYPPDSSYRPAPMPDPGQPRTPPPTQPIAPPGSEIGGSRPVTPVPTPPAPTPQHPEAVVNATRAALRNMLDLTAEQASNIRVVRVESVQWGDPSLGLPEQGRTYPQVVTPGYRVTLRYQDQFFVYHTNESGSSVKFASQTNYDPGPRLVPPGGIIASPPLQPPASYPPDSSYRPAPMPDPGQPRTPPPTQPIAPPGSAIDGSRPVTPVPTPPLTRQDDYATRNVPPTGAPLTRQDDYATRNVPPTGAPLTRQDDYATRFPRTAPAPTGAPLTPGGVPIGSGADSSRSPMMGPITITEEPTTVSPDAAALNAQTERDTARAQAILNDLQQQIANAPADAAARQASVDRALGQAGSFGINVSNNANLGAAVSAFNQAQADAAAYNAALGAWIAAGADPADVPVFSPGFSNAGGSGGTGSEDY